ncbi:hypothetical protein BHF68_06170 [Desulfuribacillus alkaliarsenatis]|uniref:Lipoprotein n=2 Tax=Desulfuribacillus alkaliarsenatis TaxID=766136 RepID=A0A1E5G1F9_9FIRM|nr:hypothetical protein BHF68_06170 [Desulfuribacillus alkaliarsenatis]
MDKRNKMILIAVIIAVLLTAGCRVQDFDKRDRIYSEYIDAYVKIQNKISLLTSEVTEAIENDEINEKDRLKIILDSIRKAENSIATYVTHIPTPIDKETEEIRNLINSEIYSLPYLMINEHNRIDDLNDSQINENIRTEEIEQYFTWLVNLLESLMLAMEIQKSNETDLNNIIDRKNIIVSVIANSNPK